MAMLLCAWWSGRNGYREVVDNVQIHNQQVPRESISNTRNTDGSTTRKGQENQQRLRRNGNGVASSASPVRRPRPRSKTPPPSSMAMRHGSRNHAGGRSNVGRLRWLGRCCCCYGCHEGRRATPLGRRALPPTPRATTPPGNTDTMHAKLMTYATMNKISQYYNVFIRIIFSI